LKWEETAQTNFGVDFSLLKNRISGSIEYYQQNTSDLIFPKTLPAVSGYVQKFENVGKTKNSGIEITFLPTSSRKKILAGALISTGQTIKKRSLN
jgi:outer membrane cobalamin receptor